eukprot:16344-Hanusia_phi.AAC.15
MGSIPQGRPKRACTERTRERVQLLLEWEEAPEHGELFRAAAARVEQEFRTEEALRRRLGKEFVPDEGDEGPSDDGDAESYAGSDAGSDNDQDVLEVQSEDSDYYPGKRGGGFRKYDRPMSDEDEEEDDNDDDNDDDDDEDDDVETELAEEEAGDEEDDEDLIDSEADTEPHADDASTASSNCAEVSDRSSGSILPAEEEVTSSLTLVSDPVPLIMHPPVLNMGSDNPLPPAEVSPRAEESEGGSRSRSTW